MTTPSDIDRIAPVPDELKLSSGTVVTVQRLKTRQFFRLLKILTRGAGPLLMEYRLDGDLTTQEFQVRLLTLIALSVPEAEDEAIEFVRSMIVPSGLIENRVLNKQDRERNEELWFRLGEDMKNPELEDTIDILEAVVRRESEDIQSLGKRMQSMMKIAQKTGQLKPDQKSSETTTSSESTPETSSADSPEPSISSPLNTDGATNES